MRITVNTVRWIGLFFYSVALIAAFVNHCGCATLRLEKALVPDIKAWYKTHSILMQGKTPKWLNGRGKSESHHFLRMPERIQRKWMAMFWDIEGNVKSKRFHKRPVLMCHLYWHFSY